MSGALMARVGHLATVMTLGVLAVAAAVADPISGAIAPVGLASVVPLGVARALGAAPVVVVVVAIAAAAATAFASGATTKRAPFFSAVAVVVAAVCGSVFFAVKNSQGFTHHGQQLLCQVLLVVGAAQLLRALSTRVAGADVDDGDVAAVVIAAAYVGAGVEKLIKSGGRFFVDADALVVDAIKAHLDHLADVGGVSLSSIDDVMASLPPTLALLVSAPALGRVIFGAGLVIELLAVALCIRHPAQVAVAGALIAMHRGIDGLMGLSFPEHEALLFIWGIVVPIARHRRRRGPS
jgi:hypothetical protein